ncbi:hypothetical protein [Photobacterium leiognathi]|uniref:hypothetical protein n=1 Tax=Photobacterium leiognathi TaxID=553611 RepID=UPI00273371CC|nr:hypothetical protein [Photobacterium leiognathi]
MKKICHYISSIRPGGGPKGYLYNLYNARENREFDIVFNSINDERVHDNILDKKINIKRVLEKILPFYLLKKYFIPNLFYANDIMDDIIINKLKSYDIVVFHNIQEFNFWISKYKCDGQKCFLFSHCPTELSYEYIVTESGNDWSCNYKRKIYYEFKKARNRNF